MSYIYLITSPSGKHYVGQSSVTEEKKIKYYKNLDKNPKFNNTSRKIINAIKKYGWESMTFVVVENVVSLADLNDREIFWIQKYNSVDQGYNITPGGEGVDSKTARNNAINQHRNMTREKKEERRKNCSLGQRKRFKEKPESELTKQRKSEAHKGIYKIESPEGRIWITHSGLKEFAKQYENEIKITYWQLFSAYRKCYNNKKEVKIYKNSNKWKITRLNESDC